MLSTGLPTKNETSDITVQRTFILSVSLDLKFQETEKFFLESLKISYMKLYLQQKT